MRQGFFDKFVSRLDRIEAPVAEAHIAELARERGFLETLFQSIDEGLVVVGDGMRLLYANRAAERMIGFDAEERRGKSLGRYLRDWGVEALLRQQVTDWARIETREVELAYPERRVVAFYARPVAYDGRTELLLILRDVTRERLAEENALADERLAAVKTLAAGVAHEIGNPLNALTIHLQLLNRELRSVKDEALRASLGGLTTVAEREVTRLDEYFQGTNAETAYLLGRCCGLRINECYGLKWENIDTKRGTITIDRQMQYQEGLIKLVSLKTRNARRTVYMSDKLKAYLRHLERENKAQAAALAAQRAQNQTFITDIDGKQISSLELVNTLPNGKIQTVNSMKYHSKTIKAKLGINFKFHYLRHTYGTRLAEMNTPTHILCNQMGHASGKVTERYYLAVSKPGIEVLTHNLNAM